MKKKNNIFIKPFLKWVGGKRQLIPSIKEHLPSKNFGKYFEPFVGAGAVLFELQADPAVINDSNAELINVYKTIKKDLEPLKLELKKHKKNNSEEYFYTVRAWDRDASFYNSLNSIEKAARIIYLNKTCYNGLYRVNNAGEFNSPYGRYKNPNILDEATLNAVWLYLKECVIEIIHGDYKDSLESVKKGDFVYFDPPYHPISNSSSFTGYTKGGFSKEDQIELRDLCIELHEKGVNFLLSNSAAQFILDIYKDEEIFNISYVSAKRSINSVAEKRGKINEVLIKNYHGIKK